MPPEEPPDGSQWPEEEPWPMAPATEEEEADDMDSERPATPEEVYEAFHPSRSE